MGHYKGVGLPICFESMPCRWVRGLRYSFSNCSADRVTDVGIVVRDAMAVSSWGEVFAVWFLRPCSVSIVSGRRL